MKRLLHAALILVAMPVMILGQNQKAPAVALRDIRGRVVHLSDYRGKVVLLNFWATWCPPCRAEMPDLVKMQQEYQARGLQVVGITYPPQRVSVVRRFVRRLKVNYPILLGRRATKTLFDQGDTLPLTVIIDREGNIQDRIEGILLPEEFETKVKPLLR